MLLRKTGFLEDLGNLGASDVHPYIFPGLIFISLIESSGIVGDQEYLMLVDIILPVVKAQNPLSFKYNVQDYTVLNEMLVGIERVALVASELIKIKIIRIFVVYEFTKIASL